MKINPFSALKIALIYFGFSLAWIIFTDLLLLAIIDDIDQYRFYSSVKGILFITLSACLIYGLIRRELSKLSEAYCNIDFLEVHDPLTGLFNRKRFEKELKTLDNQPGAFGIILLDINGLRLINELYNYEAGNEVLKHLGRQLPELIEVQSFLARTGGDSFAILLKNVSEQTVKVIAEKISSTLGTFRFRVLDITLAVGYAINFGKQSPKDVYAMAENALRKNKIADVNASSNAIISSISTALYERSDETEQHAERMAILSKALGRKLNLPFNMINDLELLATLHDIGKIGIDDAILKKPGRLTAEEYEIMKQHPVIGFKMATTIQELEHIAYLILTHHEWYDGRGYPKGLKKEEIPLLARILSIIDAFDVMTHDRVYKKAVSHQTAFAELRRCQGTQFDPDLVDVFIEMMTTDDTLLKEQKNPAQ